MKPLVSVIIPARNGEKHLRAALDSVFSQDYPSIEVLLIDNGSTDETLRVAQSYPLRCYTLLDPNTAAARNLGIARSSGPYIAFLDQDDLWLANKLSLQISCLEMNRHFGAATCAQELFLDTNYSKPHWLKEKYLHGPQAGYLPSALVVRRTTFSLTGLFNPALPLASDVDWFIALKRLNIPLAHLPEPLVRRRIHSSNTSNDVAPLQREILRSLKQRLPNI